MRTAKTLLPILFATAFAASPCAQGRRPLLGTFVGADGAAIAGAEVHCALVLAGDDGQAVDHVVATTDERGRFRCQLRPCTRHRVWAIGPPDADGGRAVSAVVTASPGELLELRAVWVRPRCVVRVEGLRPWQHLGPFRVRFVPAATGLDLPPMELSADDTFELPPSPGSGPTVDVLCADGTPLFSLGVSNSRTPTKLSVPLPQKVPMRVLDSQQKPVAGATIRQRLDGGYAPSDDFGLMPAQRVLWRELGETDADGRLVAEVASFENPLEKSEWPELFFVAEKPGHTLSYSGFTDKPFVDGRNVDEKLDELTFTIDPCEPWQGRVVDGATPIADQPLAARIELRIRISDNSWRHAQLVCRARTDADGRFTLPRIRGAEDSCIVRLSGDALRRRLVPEEQLRRTPEHFLALHRRPGDGSEPLQIDLAERLTLHVRVEDENGAPAAGVPVLLLSGARDDDYELDEWTLKATTDNAGRLEIQATAGSWLLFTRSDRGMAHRKLELADGGRRELALRMERMPSMKGRVVDADGEPVAGAELQCRGASSRTPPNRDPALQAIASACNWTWIGSTRSDEDGYFECTFLELPGMSYRGEFRDGRRKSDKFPIVTGEEPVTITIR